MDDLLWLRESGLEALILRANENKTPIIGICGGFQMLGEQLIDSEGVERGGQMRGMGLLNTKTVFVGEKTRTQIRGKVTEGFGDFEKLRGMEVSGYEIHMGLTENLGGCRPCIVLEDGRTDALLNGDGTVFGSYLHGIFDSDGVTEAVISKLCEKKGIVLETAAFDLKAYKEEQYNQLADLIRSSLDMEKVYDILNKGI